MYLMKIFEIIIKHNLNLYFFCNERSCFIFTEINKQKHHIKCNAIFFCMLNLKVNKYISQLFKIPVVLRNINKIIVRYLNVIIINLSQLTTDICFITLS